MLSELMQVEIVVSPAAFEEAVKEIKPRRYPFCYATTDELGPWRAVRAEGSDRILVDPSIAGKDQDIGLEIRKAAVFHEAFHVLVEGRHENLPGGVFGSRPYAPAFMSMARIAIHETRIEKGIRDFGAKRNLRPNLDRCSDRFCWTVREAVVQFRIDDDMRTLYEELVKGFLRLVVASSFHAAKHPANAHRPEAGMFSTNWSKFVATLRQIPPAPVYFEELRTPMIEEAACLLDKWMKDLGFAITGDWRRVHVDILDIEGWSYPIESRNFMFSSS